MRSLVRSTLVLCSLLASTCLTGSGQSATSSSGPSSSVHPASTPAASEDSGRVGAAVKISLLGIGGEAAVRVTHHSNVRAGFNMLSYSRGFHEDGISYSGHLNFKTFEAHYDFFPWAKRFHISPGVMLYVSDPITATVLVPGGQPFSLGDADYYSDSSSPVTGTGKLKFNNVAPMITIGWGNLVSRKEGAHFSVPFEFGVAFQGSPKATLQLAGNVCESPGTNCRSVATDPIAQGDILSEQSKVNHDISFLRVYPIISVGFGYKF